MKNNTKGKPITGTPNPDQRAAMVKDALDALSPSFRPDKSFSGTEILDNAMMLARAVNARLQPLMNDVNKLGAKHDKKLLSSIIGKEYLTGFSAWDKDELLYLLVFIHTQIAVETITGETGTSNLIIPG